MKEVLREDSVVLYKKRKRKQNIIWSLYRNGVTTLPQLADVLHTSVPSITDLVDGLVQENWVSVAATAIGNNGRRPSLFALNPEHHLIWVIDISTHGVSMLLVNSWHDVIFRYQADLFLENSTLFVRQLLEFIMTTVERVPVPREQVSAIGIAMPGLIDEETGLNLTYECMNLSGVSFKDWLTHEFMMPVFIINDTKATVLGESRFGKGQDKRHILSINIDWGVGLGIVLNGEVFQGASGFAGELGHIQMDPLGERCTCGKIGCLDTITSAPSVLRRIKRALRDGHESLLQKYAANPDQLTIGEVLKAARKKDPLVTKVLEETGLLLGKGLAIAINILNPEIIIIDGILSQAGEQLTQPIKDAIQMYCLGAFVQKISVENTTLDGNARWLGTHAFVMENLIATY